MTRSAAPHAAETIENLARTIAGKSCDQRDFSGLLALLAPRIAHLIRQYRLGDWREDAEQAAAIGVHRALGSFDPDKASFSTHVTWQIRGELQSLRHRVRLDQRRSSRSAGVRTVSLDGLTGGDEPREVFEVVDESALARTESGASDALAGAMIRTLLNRLDAPEDERAIIADHFFDRSTSSALSGDRTAEQRRQVVRRTLRNCAKMMAR